MRELNPQTSTQLPLAHEQNTIMHRACATDPMNRVNRVNDQDCHVSPSRHSSVDKTSAGGDFKLMIFSTHEI